MIKVFTYNLLPWEEFPFATGLHIIENCPVKIYQGIFTKDGKKNPEYVTKDDPMAVDLFANKEQTKKVIGFLGKETSGSLRIPDLCMNEFYGQLEKLFFVVCPHFPEWAVERIFREGVPEENVVRFVDGHMNKQCKEGPMLEAYMRYCARMYGKL